MSDDAIFNANNPFLPLPPESFHSYSSSIHPTPDSSTVLDKLESEVMPMPMNHKRKTRDGSSLLTYAHSQRKYNNGRKEGGLKKLKTEKKCYQKVPDEAPAPGYIHVRARRGQATDTHSLAERIRREKISERMKILQTLVPACDKVTGKALMLDEIINYVQSLQNQVEFLSMKLASANPVLYNFGMDLDIYAGGPQVMSGMCMDMVSQAQLPNYMPISNTIQPTASAAAPTILTAGNSSFIPQLDNSSSLLLEQEQLLQHEIQNTSLLNLDGVSLGMLLDSEEERQNLQNSTGSISITNNSYFFP